MAQNPRELLDLYSGPALTSMLKARRAFAKQTRKPDILAALAAVLEDEASARAAFESLAAPQKLLLHLLGAMGGQGTVRTLKAAASRVGISGFDEHLHDLMRCALVLFSTPGSVRHELWRKPDSGFYSFGRQDSGNSELVGIALALELARDGVELPPPAHSLRLFEGEPSAVQEQSPAALLHAVFTVVRWASERDISLAKTTGAVKKPDMRALENQLKDRAEWSAFALLLALGAGLLRLERGKIAVDGAATAFFALPPREQVARLYDAWLGLSTWSEFFRIEEIETNDQAIPTEASAAYGYSDVPTAETLPQARAFVMSVLRRAGSATSGQWQSLASLLEVVQDEELGFLIPRGRRRYSIGSRDEEYQGMWARGQNRWEQKFSKSEDWSKVEGRFIRQMLREPLAWLGMVATACDASGQVAAFRLTPLGAHLLGLSSAPPEASADDTPQERPLVVQPNFEIIAYTEPQHLSVLYELERFADRESAERVAHYKLSRESVYRGLQDGLSAESMRKYLERHSRSGLPQNIAYSLDDWQALFERVAVRRSAALLEADSAAELDAMLAHLPPGGATRLAPLWAVIEPQHAHAARRALAALTEARALDYSIQVGQVLRVTEELQISVAVPDLDLWLDARLAQFAEPQTEAGGQARFQITRDSLARAAELGISHEEVLAFLEQVGTPPLPANVMLTLRGWGGALAPVVLGTMSILVTEAGLVTQIAAVESLRRLLWLQIDERAALVKDEDVPTLRAELEARGLSLDAAPSTHLRPPKRPKSEATPARTRPAQRAVDVKSGIGEKIRPAIVSAHPDEDEVDLEVDLTPRRLRARLRDAIEESRCVVIRYQSKARLALRKVNPLEIDSDGGHDYLQAWDHWRSDYRIFRIDRILGLAILDETFDASQFH